MKTIDHKTPAQEHAVTSDEEAIMLLAGPGSGKTRTLIMRIERLVLGGVDPAAITILTYTNAAARVLEQRLAMIKIFLKPLGVEGEADNWKPLTVGYVGTLHGFALRMLRDHGEPIGYGGRISVTSPESASILLESKARSLGCRTALKKLMEQKTALPRPGARLTVEESVVALYHDELREAGVVDYDLILTEFRRMLVDADPMVSNPIRFAFQYLFADEVQDSAEIDWDIYLALPVRWKFFVGDPDQAIYSFRGGSVERMNQYAADLRVTVIKLEQNFRSDRAVCTAANNLILNNQRRIPKMTYSAGEEPGIFRDLGMFMTEGEEIGHVAREIIGLLENGGEPDRPLEIAVLTRTNHLAGCFRKTLTATGRIPVAQREVLELPRDWAYARSMVELMVHPDNDTLAFFNIITSLTVKSGESPKAAAAAAHAAKLGAAAAGTSINKRVMNFPEIRSAAEAAMFLSSATQTSMESRMLVADKLRELPRDAGVLELALAMGETYEIVESPEAAPGAVQVMTIHASKGHEFDVVFLAGFEDEVIPGRRRDVNIEEERRLAFVGATRARHALYVTGAEQRITPWNEHVTHTSSRFLFELKGGLTHAI